MTRFSSTTRENLGGELVRQMMGAEAEEQS